MRDQKNIRVNHLVIDDYYGAGRAAIRISQALMCNGVESNVYVLDLLKNEGCVQVRLTNVEKIKRKIFNRLNYEMVKSYKAGAMFNAEIYGDVYKDLKYLDADIIHLHFLNHGFWSKKFADVVMKRNIPVVWTLHDMWPFTGGCHYTGNCEKFTNMCSNCEILDSTRENDLAQKCLLQKIFLYSKMNIRFIGCSSWITKEANRSIIFKKLGIKCINIPNPVAGIPFVFIDKKEARKLLGINSQKKIICFGAQSATSDKRKGYKYLRKAIRMLSNNDYMLLVFGSNYQDKFLDGFQIITTGQVTDDFHLSLIYNAADVFVSPSIQENLANTVMESIACGTPVVAFNIGGMPDMVIHKINGYLATPFEIEDLATGIEYSITLTNNKIISNEAYTNFSVDKIAQNYLRVYKELMKGR